MLSDDARSKMIDFTLPNVVSMSLPWWAENFEEMSKRYKDFPECLTATGKEPATGDGGQGPKSVGIRDFGPWLGNCLDGLPAFRLVGASMPGVEEH